MVRIRTGKSVNSEFSKQTMKPLRLEWWLFWVFGELVFPLNLMVSSVASDVPHLFLELIHFSSPHWKFIASVYCMKSPSTLQEFAKMMDSGFAGKLPG